MKSKSFSKGFSGTKGSGTASKSANKDKSFHGTVKSPVTKKAVSTMLKNKSGNSFRG